jgi:hypothetical protein
MFAAHNICGKPGKNIAEGEGNEAMVASLNFIYSLPKLQDDRIALGIFHVSSCQSVGPLFFWDGGGGSGESSSILWRFGAELGHSNQRQKEIS